MYIIKESFICQTTDYRRLAMPKGAMIKDYILSDDKRIITINLEDGFTSYNVINNFNIDDYLKYVYDSKTNTASTMNTKDDESSTVTLINNNTLENKSSHVQMKAFQTLDEVNKCLKKIPYSDFIDVRILPSDGLYYVIYLES
jgi:hypothetical protein